MPVYINSVVIWNRNSTRMDYNDRLEGTRIVVDGKDVGVVAWTPDQISYEFAVGFEGKTVKLWNGGTSYMNIAEVQVFGSLVPTEPQVVPTEPQVVPTEPVGLAL